MIVLKSNILQLLVKGLFQYVKNINKITFL